MLWVVVATCSMLLTFYIFKSQQVPEIKKSYFSTIGGFLAIVPLYVDVFLRL